MKIRNKKTGEIITIKSEGELALLELIKNSLPNGLNVWEEVKEPLIKDEKIRKAVRAWAEASGLSDKLRVINEHFDCCKVLGRCDSRNICLQTEFKTTIAHANKNQYYTIDELCGEEEDA